ncbi:MAG TPA: CoA ester lyase [Ktedonobacteraceae bacterium]|nr:CoA ester lyase [Ktedonobacteraceae bacterium]
MLVLRSLLFAPANHARHVEKALSGAADGAILDLEDAVAIDEKPAARLAAQRVLEQRASPPTFTKAYVRINALTTPFAYQDMLEVVRPGLDGIILPKTESAEQVATLDWLLSQLEGERGMPVGGVDLMPIIETASGLLHAQEIAGASPRVRRLNFGAGDFSLDTNMTWTSGNEGILWARVQLVVASRAARLEPPLDTVFPNLDDLEGLATEAEQAKRLGFQGKACIHPKQVEVVNATFTPGAEEMRQARLLIDAFEQAEAAGIASLRVGAQFVDYPVAERARRVVELGEAVERRKTSR